VGLQQVLQPARRALGQKRERIHKVPFYTPSGFRAQFTHTLFVHAPAILLPTQQDLLNFAALEQRSHATGLAGS
jgi:hypothetical protein